MEAKEVLWPCGQSGAFPKRSWPKGSLSPARRCLDGRWGRPFPGRKPSSAFPPCMTFPSIRFWARPRRLVCQCCGMPLEDDGVLSREPDGSFNEDYCKWCYTGGKFVYSSLEELLEFLAGTMATAERPPEQVRAYLRARLPGLGHWKGK